MKKAFAKDDALLSAIRSAPESEDQFHLWWLGQSGFLIKWQSFCLLFDPYLSESLSVKYANTDKPHVRITERVIDPARLEFVQVVTSSHNHTDHLDAETLQAMARVNPDLKLVLPAANVEFAKERLGSIQMEMIGMDDKQPVTIDPFTFHGISAAHNEVERNKAGQPLFMGFVVQFGPWSIYHSGDTLWHKDLVSELCTHRIDLAFLPINGNEPARRVAGNLNGSEAAALAKATSTRMVIPHHFDMFEFNTADPNEFISCCHRLTQNHRVLQPGEGWNSKGLEPE